MRWRSAIGGLLTVELLPADVLFGDAVADEFAVEAFDDGAVESGGFGPFAAGFEDGGDTVGSGYGGGTGFEFRGGSDIFDALGDEGYDLAVDGVHAGAYFIHAGALGGWDYFEVHRLCYLRR